MLAFAPDGYGEVPWDIEGALNAAQLAAAGGPAPLEEAATFRTRSVPNTFGIFHDDRGHIGNLLHDLQNAILLLYAGTKL